ncbi:LOW QUALITY PROTEIN: adenylate kinase 7-like [Thalassophryne amazonica]|uniref:LOW QUALITY PROTEIN: adenylate kinase 7-like n=1 Tax=Thalassophryne amazonica TaxID=390379 RepID=UPI001470C803|nr:LOW QUALITY PROTEIN: adenylate kinase 7-like [Thalassophryne amazonica]
MANKEAGGSKRVFVSDVDSYSSKNIAQFVWTCRASELSEDSAAGQTNFHIVGSVSSFCQEKNFDFLLEKYTSPSADELLEHLLKCDVIVYNISENVTQQQIEEATWAITALHAEMENFSSKKLFILISTVMTWVKTKPQDLDDDAVLTDEDYRRRRPHPNFKNHNNLEKLVLKLGQGKKSKLSGYVVAAGLQYGKGENLFHYFFKVSWLMEQTKVPVFGEGTNYIPMIHVYDLGGVIYNIIEAQPKSKYILAVDESNSTLEDVVKMISSVLGPGQICKVPEEEAKLMEHLKPGDLEYLSIDLRLDAFLLKETFDLHWTSQHGMVENMEKIVEEYKDTRQLLPIKIYLTGPPAVGKSTVTEKLCRHYRIHHISIKEVIEEKISDLKDIVNAADPENVSEEVIEAAMQELDMLEESIETNGGPLSEQILCAILREKLNSKPCSNQGFVLDGFPKTYQQAKLIFFDEEAENQDSKSKIPTYNKTIAPDYVFVLQASDDFLIKRAQELPQHVAEKRRCTQDEFVPRLRRYRNHSTADITVLDYFDELEIHAEHIDISTDDPEYRCALKMITQTVGTPKNYGLTPQEQQEEDRRLEAERRQEVATEEAERRRRKEAELASSRSQYEEGKKNLSEVQKEEQELLGARSLPVRNYLMTHVMPSLTKAMVECCRIKAEDPADFLAEYLLRNNQED